MLRSCTGVAQGQCNVGEPTTKQDVRLERAAVRGVSHSNRIEVHTTTSVFYLHIVFQKSRRWICDDKLSWCKWWFIALLLLLHNLHFARWFHSSTLVIEIILFSSWGQQEKTQQKAQRCAFTFYKLSEMKKLSLCLINLLSLIQSIFLSCISLHTFSLVKSTSLSNPIFSLRDISSLSTFVLSTENHIIKILCIAKPHLHFSEVKINHDLLHCTTVTP